MIKHLVILFALVLTALNGLSQEVYKTKTGEKYHTEDCRYLKYSQFKITLQEAINKYGLDPCKICKPPQLKSETSINTTENDRDCATVQCQGITQKGARCKRKTKSCTGYCYQHG